MALQVDLSYSQENDGTSITITDSAGTYHAVDNPTGWGSPNIVVTDIVTSTTTTVGKYHLQLTITVTDKDGTSTAYDTIDLYDHDSTGPFVDAGDLTWTIDAADLIASGTAMGTSSSLLDDGVYAIVYQLVDAPTDLVVSSQVTESILVDGDVRITVFDMLREVPNSYDYEGNTRVPQIMEALLSYTYLLGMTAANYTAMSDELITQLYTLDKITSDGSHYTW